MKTELSAVDEDIYQHLKRLKKLLPAGIDLPNAEKWKKDRIKFNKEMEKIRNVRSKD